MTCQIDHIDLPAIHAGNQRRLTVHRFGRAGARPKAYLQASIHADELPGGIALHHLSRKLAEADVIGEVVLVPAANPIGLSQSLLGHHHGRHELNSGLNFNRDFADLTDAVWRRVGSELTEDAEANRRLIQTAMAAAAAELSATSELQALRRNLAMNAADADIVLDLHCDAEAEMHVYIGEELWPDAEDLSAELAAPVTLLALDSGGNPFDERFSLIWNQLRALSGGKPIPPGCIAATVELRGSQDVSDYFGEADAAALLRFLQRRGVVGGDPGPAPAPANPATPLAGCEVVRAPVGGILLFAKELGTMMEAGDVVAEILDQTADPEAARTPVTCRQSGRLFTRVHSRWVRPGDAVVKIAGAEPLPDRGPKLLSD